MGLFNFIKSAGRLVGIGSSAEATQDESRPAPPPPTAEAVKAELERVGLAGGDVQVQVEGERVRLSGSVPDAETREKLILAAGNIAGIGAVEEAVAAAGPPAPEPVFHTVAKGDTLSAIARKHLGDANKYHAIFEANRPMLTHPDRIYPGQVLRIPTAG